MVATVLMAAFIWSCSRSAEESRASLSDLVGADVSVVAMTRPADILESAGAVRENGRLVLPSSLTDGMLHSTDVQVITALCDAKGVSLDDMLVLSYVNPRMSALVLAVTDRGALASSLGGAGWTGSKCDGGEVYTHTDVRNAALLCDDDYLWIVKGGDAAAVSATVEALKGRAATPAPAWLAENLTAGDKAALKCAYVADSTRVYLATAILAGPSMTLEGRCVAAADGTPRTFVEPDSALTLGDASAYLNPDDMVSVGVALPHGFPLERLIQEISCDVWRMQGVAESVAMLDGRVALSAGMIDPSSFNVMDISNYRVALVLGTKPGRADALLSTLKSALGLSRMPVSAVTDGDMVVLGLNSPVRGSAGRGDAMALLSANIPADSPLLRMAGLPSGFSLQAHATNESASLTLEFSDSDKGFVATLLDIIGIIG